MILVILLVMLYATIGGVSFAQIESRGKAKCPYKDSGECDGDCGHFVVSFLSILLWPVIVPIILGVTLAGGTQEKLPRVEARRQKEIEEAKHKLQLARLNAEETRVLEQALRKD